MEQTVLSFIKKHQLLTENATVLIGVSGGPDSMALLHFFNSIRKKWNLQLNAVSIDHQLRGEESRKDLEYVRAICKEWDIPFVAAIVDVPGFIKQHQVGTELAARELRYQVFHEQMDQLNADYLALGHHGDDQVETMLMRLTRTASASMFNGMPIKREFANGMIIRPFLCITKKDIEAYCEENQIVPRIDPTNFDTIYTRNFFRKNLLPLIKEKNNNIHITIQHLSETLREDEEFLQTEAQQMVKELVEFDTVNRVASFEIESFRKHAHALQRRSFHLILDYLYKELPKDLSYVHEEYFFALLEHNKGNTRIDFPSNLKLEKSYDRLTFYFADINPHDPSYDETLALPGKVVLQDGSAVYAEYADKIETSDPFLYTCNIDQVKRPLHIRTRRAGDRMSWKGLKGSKKLKDIFIDSKIPITERDKWPILVDHKGEVLWVIGLKKGHPKSQAVNGKWIQVHYKKGNV
ncbi:tRNA lysidine(34) synthetase TilS [Oceanobacillus sp. 143]|uniref:tRNA(Ile)-lysidine synthase n=1 Tax=Oceanobacillus zhaokaii TaxID=2052660 RepID=A0A345PC28_9BACI|nr:tRNA lysidine(34) synthetase TilS [Oceanobacillus zhaokaii]AXI07558.1 tRNA lysidine(34) synthetase TilS [Oceanobacillus zhaokaii]QGS67778.1 tRNA lysidine(34) synthetase TilS [Oceanobacillus sp. 143]